MYTVSLAFIFSFLLLKVTGPFFKRGLFMSGILSKLYSGSYLWTAN